ncbi:TPA: hypothetical protein EYO12_01830 [Candidatus Saccharibacteria bacterium]|nr:hypothetical protein [Candidatus Saccharibacteria bacterium]HIO87457.1 hypothetical protein [Candidatus Saccharibacteria bacterium]
MSELQQQAEYSPVNIVQAMDALQAKHQNEILLSYDSVVYGAQETKRVLKSVSDESANGVEYAADALSAEGSILHQETARLFFNQDTTETNFQPLMNDPDLGFFRTIGLPELKDLSKTLRQPEVRWGLNTTHRVYTETDIAKSLPEVIQHLNPLALLDLFRRVGKTITTSSQEEVDQQIGTYIAPVAPSQYQNPSTRIDWLIREAGGSKIQEVANQLLWVLQNYDKDIRRELKTRTLQQLTVRYGDNVQTIFIKPDKEVARFAAQYPDDPIDLLGISEIRKGRNATRQAGYRAHFRSGRQIQSSIGVALDPRTEKPAYTATLTSEGGDQTEIYANTLFTALAALRDNPALVSEHQLEQLDFNQRLFALACVPTLREKIFESAGLV